MAESKGQNFYRMGYSSMASELGGTKGDPLAGLDKVTKALRAKQKAKEIETKAIEAEELKARKDGGQKISNAFIEMGPSLKTLGPESFGKAQEEVESLRQEMFAAIDAKDQKKIAELNIRLNEIKTRHSTDAENLTTLIESWEDETVSTDAMTKEDMKVMENFATNPTKRVVYDEDNVMMYEWDVDTGEVDKDGNPIMETERYSMEQMQDMIITKETENGVKMLDYGEEIKTAYKDGSPPSDAKIKTQVRNIIPQDKKALRDWLHGNPAEQDGLNVHEYLVDLMGADGDLNTFKSLGIDLNDPQYAKWDVPGSEPGIQADEIPQDFKDELIRGIMNVDDMEKSHEIISDIYANLLKNNMMGIENKDYRPLSETTILGSEVDSSAKAVNARKERLIKLQSLEDSKNPIHADIGSMDQDQVAKHLGFYSINDKIYNDTTGQWESISTYIAPAVNKKAKGANVKTNEEYYNLID